MNNLNVRKKTAIPVNPENHQFCLSLVNDLSASRMMWSMTWNSTGSAYISLRQRPDPPCSCPSHHISSRWQISNQNYENSMKMLLPHNMLWKKLTVTRVARIEPHRLGYSSDMVPSIIDYLKQINTYIICNGAKISGIKCYAMLSITLKLLKVGLAQL